MLLNIGDLSMFGFLYDSVPVTIDQTKWSL